MQKPLRVYLTGEPGVGKTTLFMKIVNEIQRRGLDISGFYCPEIRERGSRVGFKIKSLDNEVEDWLASIYVKSDIKIGKYYIILKDDTVDKLKSKIEKATIVGIDEIGPMELSVPKLKDLINYILKEKTYVIAVVHRKILFKDGKTFKVTHENREALLNEILSYIISFLNSLD